MNLHRLHEGSRFFQGKRCISKAEPITKSSTEARGFFWADVPNPSWGVRKQNISYCTQSLWKLETFGLRNVFLISPPFSPLNPAVTFILFYFSLFPKVMLVHATVATNNNQTIFYLIFIYTSQSHISNIFASKIVQYKTKTYNTQPFLMPSPVSCNQRCISQSFPKWIIT